MLSPRMALISSRNSRRIVRRFASRSIRVRATSLQGLEALLQRWKLPADDGWDRYDHYRLDADRDGIACD
jgi:hypothetical protein